MKNFYFALVLILLVSPIMAQNIPSYVPKDGLVGYWPFNGNANDESGRGDHGKVNNCKLVKDRLGKENSAYYFDKNYSYIELNNENHAQLSFATWIKLHNVKDSNAIISKGSFFSSNSGSESFVNYCSTSTNIIRVSNGSNLTELGADYTDTSYHFVVVIYDQKAIKYYLDGKLMKISSDIQGPINPTTQNKYIGALKYGKDFLPEYFLKGTIDELSMWNRALSEKEIQALYEGNSCPINAAISPQGSVKICEGSALELKTITDTNYAFQWFKDNQPIAGATSKSYKVTKAGQYALRVSDPVCSSTSPITTIDTIPLPAAPALSNTYQKVCGMEPINMISQRLTNYNSAITLKWYRNEIGNDSISKYMQLDPFPKNYFVSQLSATSPQCESPKRTMVFIDVNMPASINAKGNTTFCQGDSVVLEAFANGNSYDYAWKKEYNWIEGSEGKNTFVAKESGRYSYQNKMCDMQMGGNEIIVNVKPNLKVNVGKITGSSVEFVWDTLSLSPKPIGYEVSYSINYKTAVQKTNIPAVSNFTVPGLNKGDTVFISIVPQGTDCKQTAFVSAVAQEIVIPSNIPTNGLVGYWPFNGNANDESGKGNHGTVNGATLTSDRNGKANSAYSFDGVDNFIRCINSGPTGNPTITASFWMKTNQSTYGHIIGYGNNGINGSDFRILIAPSTCKNTIQFDTYGSVLANIDTLNNTWDFYTVIYDGSVGSSINITKIYKNGVLLTSICNSINNSVTNISNLIPITFGRYHGTVQTGFYNGLLDDIAIYNRALSEQEVKQLYGLSCPKETATSSSFNSLLLSSGSSVLISAEPQGGVFKSTSVEQNQFIPSKAKIGMNKVQYNFKNSQGCNDSTLFTMIVADTAGTNCKKYDTITITNTLTKYDTVKVTKFDTITITNKVTTYDTITVKNNVYDTVTITNNVTKYDTITLTDTVSILKIKFKLTTGIQANQMASISLYPNPTTDVLHIEVGDVIALEGYRYRILDALGKEVYNELVKNTITEIPLKSLGAAGLYQFEVLDEQNVSIQANKIVLQ